MSRWSAELPTTPGNLQDRSSAPSTAEAEMRELERKITSNQPISVLLGEVVGRVCSLTHADGAAVAVRDQSGITCRASTGDAPEVGSRLAPDSALTRECFESGQVVVCEDTETDYRVRSSTGQSLRLRSAVVVPLEISGLILGVIEILSSRPFAFDTTHIAGLRRIAQLLAPVLAPASAQPEGSKGTVLAPVPPPFEPEERKPRVRALLVAGASLLLLSLLLFFAVPLYRPARAPSAQAIPSASAPGKSSERPREQRTGQAEAVEGHSLTNPNRALGPGLPPSTGSLPASADSPQPSAGATSGPPEQPVTIESPATEIALPAVPALVIQGAPPGAQIFVDDRLVSSIGSDGQAKISTLAPGQHSVRLKLDAWDYSQGIEVEANQTSTVTAKLEPFELPTLSASVKAPILAVAPALPASATSTRTSPPDFLLDRTLKGHSGWVTAVAFNPDGRRLASGSWDESVKFWEVSTGEQLSTIASKMKEVQALAFSRDGRWLATENSSNTVSLRDATTGREIRTLSSDKPLGAWKSNWVYSIAFSPDGQWLASGIDDKTVRLWDVKTGGKVRDLTADRRPVIYVAFSPDGRLLASGDDDKTITISDVASGKEVHKLSGHKKSICAVAFSPNGRWLASASADKTVKLWDVGTGREVHTLNGHGGVVTSIAFSPDGRWLVSGSWDKTIKVWEVDTGREVQTLTGHDRPVYSVAFDSRGQWVASGSEDSTIKLWRLAEAADQRRLRR
jgi:WD40 repeat protein